MGALLPNKIIGALASVPLLKLTSLLSIKNFLVSHLTAFLDRIAVLRTQMRSIVTDRVAWSVGRSVTLMSPANVEPTEMPFGLRTRVGPGNHVLDGDPDPPWEGAILRGGKGRPIVKYRDTLRSSVQKRLNR